MAHSKFYELIKKAEELFLGEKEVFDMLADLSVRHYGSLDKYAELSDPLILKKLTDLNETLKLANEEIKTAEIALGERRRGLAGRLLNEVLAEISYALGQMQGAFKGIEIASDITPKKRLICEAAEESIRYLERRKTLKKFGIVLKIVKRLEDEL